MRVKLLLKQVDNSSFEGWKEESNPLTGEKGENLDYPAFSRKFVLSEWRKEKGRKKVPPPLFAYRSKRNIHPLNIWSIFLVVLSRNQEINVLEDSGSV